MKINIDMTVMKVTTDEGNYRVTNRNGSGLYYLEGNDLEGNPSEVTLTTNELKKFIGRERINQIDEVFELLYAKEMEYNWTDDGLNFISETQLNRLKFKEDYEEVEWVLIEEPC